MITNKEYEKIKRDYNSKLLRIDINLAVIRKDMNMAGNKTSIYWSASFTIMMLLSFVIGIYCIGALGILYGIFLCIFLLSYIGICSINSKFKDWIFIISFVGVIVAFFLPLKIAILLVFAFFNFISVYLYYMYIQQEAINLIFNHVELFEAYLQSNVIVLKYK